MIIKPYIVYGFAAGIWSVVLIVNLVIGLTEYNGKIVYFVNKTDFVGQNITVNEQVINFNKFAKYHNKDPG